MKILCTLTALAAAALVSAAAFGAATPFNVSGTISSDFPPPASSALSGTLTIDPATGAIDGLDLNFTSPSTTITMSLPSLTFLGPETAPGPAGSHLYEIEACASMDCGSNWLIEMGLDVTPTVPSLIGYNGGKIATIGLFFGGVADTWGGCPVSPAVASPCGTLSTSRTTGVPEPASAALLILGLTATCLRRRRRLP
jgi:hypothetical protein